ncbi:hypothetical protein P43SY_006488 [Pythium insidiosum]|uniref:Protein kinase domain-containing protein n=1 Tax=Pythium insidiosum TaxID=114742 RepID=A0AAD5LGM0_PYTIN|nr:hypothetical protein P43SY_006488 [Pythium insidiosum]
MMNVSKCLAALVACASALDAVAASGGSDSNSSIIYAVVGVVVVLFVGAAVFVWLRSKRKKKDGIEAPAVALPNPPRRPQDNYRDFQSPHAVGAPPQPQPGRQPSNPPRPQPQAPVRSDAPRSHPPPPPRHQQEPNQDARAPRRTGNPSETAARVLAEFQADPELCRRKIPYAALYFTRVLSKGAFGEVWLAQLENRQVAVKRILNEKKNDEKEIECFASEIKLMASFFHPKIVEFVGVSWSTLQDLCAVTEYMAKGDLYVFLKRKNGQLNWRDHKIYLAEDVADALGYLHSLTPKVIHRDLKSKNILLDDSFRAKLSDFGISRERSLEETMTAGVGTIYWTAPEVLMGKKYTEKADIYSFGIVMSELDTHEVPYSDMRDDAGKKLQGMKIVQQVIRKKLRPTFSPSCPPKVRELATRCLDAEPDVRPDASELLQIIQHIQRKL